MQNTWIAPRSSFSSRARIIPASSYSKKRPWDVGKTRIGCPACPNTSDSMSRPNSWLYCLLYSRCMRARIVTEPYGLRHLPVLNGSVQPGCIDSQGSERSSEGWVRIPNFNFTNHWTDPYPH